MRRESEASRSELVERHASDQPGAAQETIRGKQSSDQAQRLGACSRIRALQQTLRAPGGRKECTSYVSDTAEDLPPSPGAWSGSSRTNQPQYSEEFGYKQFFSSFAYSALALRSRTGTNIETPLGLKQFSQRNNLEK